MAAKEAADMALKGDVKATSKDGYSIGTFAGGCFWCVEARLKMDPVGITPRFLPYMYN